MSEAGAKPQATMDFVVLELRKDPDLSFADLRDRAALHGVSVYPVAYRRAKLQLGLDAPRRQSRSTDATAPDTLAPEPAAPDAAAAAPATASDPMSAMDFVVAALREDPGVSFADVRDRAASGGLTIYPIVYGRAKALLGLVPVAPRGEGKQALATAARKEAAERDAPAAAPSTAFQAPRPQPSNAPRSVDRLDDVVDEFRRMAEERERYREALQRIRAVLGEALG